MSNGIIDGSESFSDPSLWWLNELPVYPPLDEKLMLEALEKGAAQRARAIYAGLKHLSPVLINKAQVEPYLWPGELPEPRYDVVKIQDLDYLERIDYEFPPVKPSQTDWASILTTIR